MPRGLPLDASCRRGGGDTATPARLAGLLVGLGEAAHWRGVAPFLLARAVASGALDEAALGPSSAANLVVCGARAAAAHPLEKWALRCVLGLTTTNDDDGALADGWRVAAVAAVLERRLLGPGLGVAAAVRLRSLANPAASAFDRPAEAASVALRALCLAFAAVPAAVVLVACGRCATFVLFGPPPNRRKRERRFARRLERALDRTAPLPPPDAAEPRPLARARPASP